MLQIYNVFLKRTIYLMFFKSLINAQESLNEGTRQASRRICNPP